MKAKRKSAGILLYRFRNGELQLFLVHPGGPFWQHKDEGVWSIPKGEFKENETPLSAAIREFAEETGTPVTGPFRELKPVIQKAGKMVYAWAVEGDINPLTLKSNSCAIEWPPKSGKWKSYPEVDKGEWFDVHKAKQKINPAQQAFIDELSDILSGTKLL